MNANIESSARELIVSKLKEIEKKEGIRIIFAIENGSRAWRMDSANSDYDVRYVFVRPLEQYLKVNLKADVIENAYDKEGRSVAVEGSYADMVGFDIFKYVRLLWNSNPTAIEWAISDILYLGERPKSFTDFAEKSFKAITLYFHYKSMSRNNYQKYVLNGNDVTYKRYLYTLRGLVCAKYVIAKKKVPPISLLEALEELKTSIPNNIYELTRKIIEIKKKGVEKGQIDRIPELDSYLENFYLDDSEAPREKQLAVTTILDQEIFNQITKP